MWKKQMNKKIAVIICNYNKREYVIPCIQSVLDSTAHDLDLYVVDNASTDDSVSAIKEAYRDQVILIENIENLGGSGGFNTGLKMALASAENYQYLMCVDNDIIMDRNNIQELYYFLENHKEIGMVGSKICRMQQPERLQELGSDIDFDKCFVVPHYKNYLDNEDIPEIQYCDYVPACSLMIRRDVVDKIGIMPERNFIYWDDMEWGYKVNLAGYKVAAYSKAKVLHAMGANTTTNYFSTYYFWRNRIRFFAKYTPAEKQSAMMDTILENLFQTLYGCYYKGKENQIKTMMYAWDDAIHENGGKATNEKILPKDVIEDRLAGLILDKKRIIIYFDGNYKFLQEIILKAAEINSTIQTVIVCENVDQMKIQHPECSVVSKEEQKVTCSPDVLVLQMCEHVKNITDQSLQRIYVDGYGNLLENQRDLKHFENYKYVKELFLKSQRVLFEEYINKKENNETDKTYS